MKKRILALLAAGTMLLTGCGAQNAAQSDAANSGSDDLQHLTVVLDWYPNALHAFLYEAQEKGYFAEEGLDVDIQSPAGVNRCHEHGCRRQGRHWSVLSAGCHSGSC